MNSNDWKDKLAFAYSTNPNYNPNNNEEEEQVSVEPQKQVLRVRLEKKNRGGKTVSIVTGFVGSEEELKNLAKHLKSRCGVGGSVKDDEIIIQGDFRDKILNLLQELGYKNVKKAGG
ncbi:MAG: translation initiation factor [Bacteroidales bacterium]|jgi:translation initiation factor 1|nr:translation initiation factor [Bacteroidales bacterium]MDD4384946.1 translation initiation factor [Bacteroidales bacterium]MDY0197027.1 translation initiation factor [Tenuifilaceae bacterium]